MTVATRFKWEELYNKTADELTLLFKAHQSINLMYNKLGNKPTEQLVKIFQALPKDLIKINLHGNGLGSKSTEELIKILQALPEGLIKISLAHNLLKEKTTTELIQILAALPRNLTSIDFRANFYNKSAKELVLILRVLPQSLTSINLDIFGFDSLTTEETAEVFTALPPGLISIVLGKENLDKKNAKVFKSLPPSLQKMRLRLWDLGRKTTEQVVDLFTALPAGLTSLDLTWNHFDEKTAEDLVKIFAALPKTLTSINLSSNYSKIIDRRVVGLIEIIEALPQNVKHIKLNESDITNCTPNEFNILKEYACTRGITVEIGTIDNTSFTLSKTLELSHTGSSFVDKSCSQSEAIIKVGLFQYSQPHTELEVQHKANPTDKFNM